MRFKKIISQLHRRENRSGFYINPRIIFLDMIMLVNLLELLSTDINLTLYLNSEINMNLTINVPGGDNVS